MSLPVLAERAGAAHADHDNGQLKQTTINGVTI
jgi:hypothetical protein